jgi:hypothetical protein
VFARARIQKVPGNYNWNTKGVKKKSENFQKISQKKKCKKWNPLLSPDF